MKTNKTHLFFWGGIYSNFHLCKITEDGIEFNCSEQYFMYKKAKTFGDDQVALLILSETIPKQQKALGRKVKNFNQNKWDSVSYEIMKQACRLKFSQNEDLKKQLLSNKGLTFVEASPYDTIWGVGLGENDRLILDEKNWRGKNLLGKILTELAYDM